MLFIVGKRPDAADLADHAAGGGKVGDDEYAIVVDPAMLANIAPEPTLDAIGFGSATFTAPPPGEPIDPTVSGPDVIGIA